MANRVRINLLEFKNMVIKSIFHLTLKRASLILGEIQLAVQIPSHVPSYM